MITVNIKTLIGNCTIKKENKGKPIVINIDKLIDNIEIDADKPEEIQEKITNKILNVLNSIKNDID